MPEAISVPLPKDRGESASVYLESKGLMPRKGTIRSSDYEDLRKCEYLYYLKHRLGLQPALSSSDALVGGQWYHTALEGIPFSVAWEARRDELLSVCKALGLSSDSIGSILEREEKMAKSAYCWHECSMKFYHPSVRKTTEEILAEYEVIDKEVLLQWREPEWKVPAVVRLDLLLYSKKQNSLYIADAKTCGGSPLVRMSTAPLEFQVRLYRFVVQKLLDSGALHEKYPSLPKDVSLSGMIHICVRKPSILMGQNDRNFELVTKTLKSGPRKGQTVTEKNYYGDPSFDNYLARCSDWYFAKGDYSHLAIEWETDPPVNISTTFFAAIPLMDNELQLQLNRIHEAASCTAFPDRFPRSGSFLREFGKLNIYHPFYFAPFHEWPKIIEDEGFIVSFRDSDAIGDSE